MGQVSPAINVERPQIKSKTAFVERQLEQRSQPLAFHAGDHGPPRPCDIEAWT